MNKLSYEDLDYKNKKALIRVDFNVPMKNGKITDDTRIKASLPTIEYVLKHGGAVILMSHLGRPNGQKDPQYSLKPCADRLQELLGKPVKMGSDCIGPQVKKEAENLKTGEILLLENLRFHPEEENPEINPSFTNELADLGDLYINDAFGTAHRAHASTVKIAEFFPGKAAAGSLMQNEIAYLGAALLYPKRPFFALLGGAKISTKFKVIESLMKKAEFLFIGGAMAYTFFKAQNYSIGRSLYEPDFVEKARLLLENQSKCKILLPIDVIAVKEINSQAETKIVRIEEGIPEKYEGVDIGPETIYLFSQKLKEAQTIFWNGPLGVFECPPFDKGTNEIAKSLARFPAATVIIGGGDTVAAIEKLGIGHRMSHLSTGGGATLEYLEFGQLPGIEALSNKSN